MVTIWTNLEMGVIIAERYFLMGLVLACAERFTSGGGIHRHGGCILRNSSGNVPTVASDLVSTRIAASRFNHQPSKDYEMNTGAVITWDYKAQPDWDAINFALIEQFDAFIHEVDSGTDEYVIVVGPRDMTPDQINARYQEWIENDREN